MSNALAAGHGVRIAVNALAMTRPHATERVARMPSSVGIVLMPERWSRCMSGRSKGKATAAIKKNLVSRIIALLEFNVMPLSSIGNPAVAYVQTSAISKSFAPGTALSLYHRPR